MRELPGGELLLESLHLAPATRIVDAMAVMYVRHMLRLLAQPEPNDKLLPMFALLLRAIDPRMADVPQNEAPSIRMVFTQVEIDGRNGNSLPAPAETV